MSSVMPKRGGLPIAIESILYALECDNIGCDRLRAAIQAALDEAEQRAYVRGRDEDKTGYCPHGFLKCFYCWRDAGFPGEINR